MTNSMTYHCDVCNRALEQCDNLEHECDEMWIAAANDGQGGERVYCSDCFDKGKLQK